MTQDQVIKQREALIDDLSLVLENHMTDIGVGLMCTDVIGAIEFVKMSFFMAAMARQKGEES